MVANPIKEFGKAIEFLGMELDQARLEKAVEFSSFENLKNKSKRMVFKRKLQTQKAFLEKVKFLIT